MKRALAFVAATTALALAGAAMAADDAQRDFCADRPGKGSPPCVLDAGRFQVELSAADTAFSRGGGTSVDDFSYAGLELRRGLTSRLEGQLDWTPYEHVKTKDRASGAVSTVSGAGDLTLGLRWSLRNPAGDGVSIALQPYVTAPTGADGVGAGKWQGGVLVPVSIALPAGWSLALTPRLDERANADGPGHHAGYAMVAGLGHALGPMTLGAELWVDRDEDPSGGVTQKSFDLTAAWAPRGLKDVQFDASAYVGLNRQTPDLELVVGVARRF